VRAALVVSALLIVCLSPARAQVDMLASWEGEVAGEQFGITVAIGGDANGDGWADLAVGSSTSDEGGNNAGKVSLFFGRPVALADPDLEILGPAESLFGSAVAWAGDVNDDGYADLLVGAFRESTGGLNTGKAFVFFGGEPMDDVPDLELAGSETGGYFGRAVAGAGDVNGDGVADFAIGAPRTDRGSVYVFFGGAELDDTPDLVLHGAASGDRFGSSVAGCGNVDAAAGDDLLVGAPRSSADHAWEGSAWLFSGGAAADTLPDWTVRGEFAGDQFGTDVEAAGDVNGDGHADMIVGAPYHNASSLVDAGAAYVFFGGASPDTIIDFRIEGTETEENLGRSVAGCGDVTGSGFDHAIAGAPGGAGGGRVFVSPGGDPPSHGDLITIEAEQAGDEFGFSVGGVGALGTLSHMGDEKPDLAAGAWSRAAGKAYVYGVPTEVSVPQRFPTLRAYPNPAPLSSQVAFDVPAGTRRARLRVYDVAGRLVRTVETGGRSSAPGTIRWDGRDEQARPVASGVYLLNLEIEGHTTTAKTTILR
jgi:hypothetical protein